MYHDQQQYLFIFVPKELHRRPLKSSFTSDSWLIRQNMRGSSSHEESDGVERALHCVKA
jgi:hypothetical protein